MQIDQAQRTSFLEELWGYYARNGRSALPWRQPDSDGNFDPYKVLVSELMLQQTQVSRVIPKYEQFLQLFPTVHTLAGASLGDVLRAWQGLGYNRRAKFLWQAAQIVDNLKYFPDTAEALVKLPGVGKNTAGAIVAYAYDRPALFVETNVRTVYIHHFFAGQTDVDDKEVIAVLDQTVDREHTREFYWALMDYGSHLKATVGNLSRASKHFTKQSTFHGSRRQIRGQVLRLLGEGPKSAEELATLIADERLATVLAELMEERLISEKRKRYTVD